MHAVVAALHLVGKGRLGGGQRIGVRHFEDRRHPTHDGRARSRFQILLVIQPWLAEMHLAVDHSGQDVKAGAVDGFSGLRRVEGPETGNPVAPNGDIAEAFAVLIDHGSALEDQVIGLGQFRVS